MAEIMTPFAAADAVSRENFNAKLSQANEGFATKAHTHGIGDLTSGLLPVAKGGTGAADAAGARTNLGVTPANIGAATAAQGVKADYALPKAGGTMTGALVAVATTPGTNAVRNSYAGTGAMTAGSTALTTGTVYMQYE